ncbi:MAG: hypothetical protein OJF49_002000 [Ktedonobacterales bacterium]|nr:MAG: hypothetical protein OJF49_002000 [Ktedonobacterales bacterium]
MDARRAVSTARWRRIGLAVGRIFLSVRPLGVRFLLARGILERADRPSRISHGGEE